MTEGRRIRVLTGSVAQGQPDLGVRTIPGLAFDPEGTAVLLYDSLRQSETDAGSLSECVSRIEGFVYERPDGATRTRKVIYIASSNIVRPERDTGRDTQSTPPKPALQPKP